MFMFWMGTKLIVSKVTAASLIKHMYYWFVGTGQRYGGEIRK